MGELHKYRLHNVEGLERMKERGRGSYGAVYELSVNGVPCIGKRLHNILVGRVSEIQISEEDRRSIVGKFKSECETLSRLRHPNIVQFMGVHFGDSEDDIVLVMEYLHMDLETCINKYNSTLSLPYKLKILRDVAYGLSYLHSCSVIHRDLNQGNVLLTQALSAKIADLGASKVIDYSTQLTGMSTVPGALGYMPPEAMCSPAVYNTQLDSFSYGHLSLYLLLGKYPHLIDSDITALDVEAKTIQIAKRRGSLKALGTSHIMYDIIRNCLSDEPNSRPTSRELATQLTKLCSSNIIPYTNILDYAEALHKVQERVMGSCQISQQPDTPTTTGTDSNMDHDYQDNATHYMALQTNILPSSDIYTSLQDHPPQVTNDTYLALVDDHKPTDDDFDSDHSPKTSLSPLSYDDNDLLRSLPAQTKYQPPSAKHTSSSSTSSLTIDSIKAQQRSKSPSPFSNSHSLPPLPPRPLSATPTQNNHRLSYDYVEHSGRRFNIEAGTSISPVSPHRAPQQQPTDLFSQFDSDDDDNNTESTMKDVVPPKSGPSLPPRNNNSHQSATLKQKLSEGTYIYGGLSREVGEALCCNPGDFLVRTSRTTGGKVLTVKRGECEYGHLSIHQTSTKKNKPAYFFNDGELFENIPDLIISLTSSLFEAEPKQLISLINPVTTEERKILKPNEFVCSRSVVQKRQYTLTSGRVHSNNEEVVMKMFTSNQAQILKEGYYLSQLDHPNVVRMIGMSVEKPICLLLEKSAKNSLIDHLLLKKTSDAPQLLNIVNELVNGLSYLHANGIIHRNIAARNCIVSSDFTVAKISNLQRCARVTKNKPTITDYTNFAIGWASPEVLNTGEYSQYSDVWSFGILMWETFSQGREPYCGLTKTQILDKIGSQSMIQLPSYVPTNYQEMFSKCLVHRPQDRPRLSQLQYLYIKSANTDSSSDYI